MSQTQQVLVIARDRALRTAVRHALAGGDFTLAAEGEGLKDAVTAADRPPAVCLVSAEGPGWADIVRGLVHRLPDAAVVVVDGDPDPVEAVRALRAGAEGYLRRGDVSDRLPQTLTAVLTGELVLPRRLVGPVIRTLRAAVERTVALPSGQVVELTRREAQVLALLRRGWSTQEIAAELFVSPITVRTHVSSIVRKLRVEDRYEALRLLDAEP